MVCGDPSWLAIPQATILTSSSPVQAINHVGARDACSRQHIHRGATANDGVDVQLLEPLRGLPRMVDDDHLMARGQRL